MALEYDRIDVLRVLCDITLKIIEGELYQLTKNGDTEITEDERFDIIRRKTAYLFAGCCTRIGGMVGHLADPGRRSSAHSFGVAFQLVDDLLDYKADQAALGKPIGSNLREGKLTLPIILLRDRVPDQARPIIKQVVRDADISDEAWRQLLRPSARVRHRPAGHAAGRRVHRPGPSPSSSRSPRAASATPSSGSPTTCSPATGSRGA